VLVVQSLIHSKAFAKSWRYAP